MDLCVTEQGGGLGTRGRSSRAAAGLSYSHSLLQAGVRQGRLKAEGEMPLLGHSLAEKPLQRASSSNYGPVNVPGRGRATAGITELVAEGSGSTVRADARQREG